MPTASSIDFLQPSVASIDRPSVWGKLGQQGMAWDFAEPVHSTRSVFGVDGAFVLDRKPRVTWKMRLSGSLAALILSSLVLSSLYPAGRTQILAARSRIAPQLAMAQAASSSASTRSATSASIGAVNADMTPSSDKKNQNPPVTAKTGSTTPAVAQPAAGAPEYSLKRDVFGFLPYWFVGKTTIQYDKLSDLAYFGVEVNADGSINHDEPGYQTLMSDKGQAMMREVKQHQTRFVMTYRAFNSDQIASIIADPGSRDRAAMIMVDLAKSVGAQGANIDFENADHPDDTMRNNFTAFVSQVTTRFHQMIPGSEVTVSTYAAAARFYKLYDVEPLSQVSDGLFIMAYDFYGVNSSKAGPVAPLHGYPNTYWYDVTIAVEDFLKAGVPANKMILGVPYYGYDWPVAGNQPGAPVTDGAANSSSYKGSVNDPQNNSNTKHWDDVAQEPYYTYQQNGQWRTTYYDDAQSLGKKYDLINQYNLKGAGIWALGQEGDAPELWQLLATKFGK